MARVLLLRSRLRRLRNPEVVPPMGLMYIAAALQAKGHEVQITDANLRTFSLEGLRRQLYSFKPEVVGIGALTAEATFLHDLAALVKEERPSAMVVAGSHYPSSEPETVLKDPNVDVVAVGEGEYIMQDLVEALENNLALEEVRGLVFRKDGRLHRTPPAEILQDLDVLPFPAWDLIDLPLYASHPTMGTRVKDLYMSVVTSRGCPYRCTYCHLLHGKRFRSRSVENVLAELRVLQARYGVKELLIIDDIFNLDLERAKGILRGIVQEKLKFKLHFPNAIRGDICDEAFLQLLKEAGTELLCLAVESASPRIQKMVKRNLDLKKIQWTISRAKEVGLYTMGFFILGFPGESREEMLATLSFARNSDLHSASFFILIPHPGTELGDVHYQSVYDQHLMHDGFLPPHLMFNQTKLSNRQIKLMLLRAHLSFYLHPKRLFSGPYRFLVRRYTEFFIQLPLRVKPLLGW